MANPHCSRRRCDVSQITFAEKLHVSTPLPRMSLELLRELTWLMDMLALLNPVEE